MRNKKRFGAGGAWILIAVSLGIAFILTVPVTPRLLILHNGAAVLFIRLPESERFIIRYNHSVNRSEVDDTIERSGNDLIVRSSLYQTFGAGIPVADDMIDGRSAGTSLKKTENGLLLEGIDTVYKEINLLTGTYADHRIITEDTQYVLKDIVGEKELIKIKPGYVSLLRLFTAVVRNNFMK